MSLDLTGRVGMVLGVSSENSIGFHSARALLARGAQVLLTYRPRPGARGPELAAKLGCEGLELDTSDEQSVVRAFAIAGERWERLDFMLHTLVHVPEGVVHAPLLALSRTDFATTLDASVYSLLTCAKYALPWLRCSDSPRIVTLLSGGGEHVMPHYHAVGIAKAALAACLRYLASELGPTGVLCNGVNFSLLETSAAQRVIGKETSQRTSEYLAKHSLTRRPLSIEDVTSSIAFLCSTECRNVTGEIITVDGGYHHGYF